jgi:hypothetical protein
MPAGAPAAWIFRAILDPREHETLPVARRVILAFLAPAGARARAGARLASDGISDRDPARALPARSGLCAAELQLAGYRKIPLTCPTPGFRDHLLMLCLVQFLGFELFTRAGAGMEGWMLAAPWRLLFLPLAMLGGWYWNRQRLRSARGRRVARGSDLRKRAGAGGGAAEFVSRD